MEQDHGFGFGIGGMAEVVEVAVGPPAADDRGPWCCGDGLPLEADGDFAVVTHAHAGLLAPDVGPPRAGRHGAQDGSFFGQCLVPGGLGGVPSSRCSSCWLA